MTEQMTRNQKDWLRVCLRQFFTTLFMCIMAWILVLGFQWVTGDDETQAIAVAALGAAIAAHVRIK